jgi:hypothetical protein
LLYGTAYNAPDREVLISMILENGRILTEAVAQTDIFGYWEISLFIPEDSEGPAFINVLIGIPNEEGYAQNQTEITIE